MKAFLLFVAIITSGGCAKTQSGTNLNAVILNSKIYFDLALIQAVNAASETRTAKSGTFEIDHSFHPKVHLKPDFDANLKKVPKDSAIKLVQESYNMAVRANHLLESSEILEKFRVAKSAAASDYVVTLKKLTFQERDFSGNIYCDIELEIGFIESDGTLAGTGVANLRTTDFGHPVIFSPFCFVHGYGAEPSLIFKDESGEYIESTPFTLLQPKIISKLIQKAATSTQFANN